MLFSDFRQAVRQARDRATHRATSLAANTATHTRWRACFYGDAGADLFRITPKKIHASKRYTYLPFHMATIVNAMGNFCRRSKTEESGKYKATSRKNKNKLPFHYASVVIVVGVIKAVS